MKTKATQGNPAYTAIPDTTDANYWQLKQQDGEAKLTVFTPRDKGLHRKLLTKQRARIQAATERKQQLDRARGNLVHSNRATWGLGAPRAR